MISHKVKMYYMHSDYREKQIINLLFQSHNQCTVYLMKKLTLKICF